jgi:hypothetical protein
MTQSSARLSELSADLLDLQDRVKGKKKEVEAEVEIYRRLRNRGTEDTPLEMQELEDGLVVARWIYDCEPPPFYQPLLKFSGRCDRLQHYEVRFPSIAINKSVYCPVGSGGPEWQRTEQTYEMTSYNLLTPIDQNSTRYFWLQQRNTDPDDEQVTNQIVEGAKLAFLEDKEILEAVHGGIEEQSSRPINLAIDAGAIRFRNLLQQRIERECQSAV